MKNNILDKLFIPVMILVSFVFMSFIAGIFAIAHERDLYNENRNGGICEYKSYASMYNPFYKAGCELFEVRK